MINESRLSYGLARCICILNISFHPEYDGTLTVEATQSLTGPVYQKPVRRNSHREG